MDLIIADRKFSSRFFIGTGKFSSNQVMKDCIEASEAEMVTVALRRLDLDDPGENMLDFIDVEKYQLLPNTSGARDAEEAVRLAKLARASGLTNWVKLEVTPEPRYLLPDGEETLKAAKELVDLGFVVLPYIQPDPILAKKLEEAGTATVMPLASPIGSNKGLRNIDMLKIIIEQANIPVVVDAGIGRPSDAELAMEIGADAVLVNTAIATAKDPVSFSRGFRESVEQGRLSYELSCKSKSAIIANASSPTTGYLR